MVGFKLIILHICVSANLVKEIDRDRFTDIFCIIIVKKGLNQSSKKDFKCVM